MIIDCHTHLWDWKNHLGGTFVSDFARVYAKSPETLSAYPDEHFRAMEGVDKCVVVAFRSVALGCRVPNEYVAKYVDKHPEKLIGFCCVDPNQETAAKEIKKCVIDLHMKGLKLGPIYQHFDPRSRKAMQVFETAEELNIPVLIHQGTTFVKNAPLKYAYPSLLDEVANKFDGLKIIVAHLGHPWEDETIALIRKQPNVYADISGLLFRPFRLYMKLMTCIEYGAAGKLVFGSDFPFSTPRLTLNSLRSVNRFRTNTVLPEVPAEIIHSIIEKNASQILQRGE